MSQSVLFTVIIPTYNRSKQLRRALDSVFSQTFKDYEVLVVDDGSTDDTCQVLQTYQDCLKYIRQANAGSSVARNAGIEHARGAYIAFLDDDDSWYPRKLELIAQAIDAHPEAGLFHSRVDYVDENGNWLWTTSPPQGNDYLNLLQGNFIANLSVVIKRSCFDKVGVFEPSLKICEDWDLYLRLAQHFQIVFVPETLAEYRFLSKGGLTSRFETMIACQNLVLENALESNPKLSRETRTRALAALAFRNGRILFHAGENDRALREFSTALDLNPRSWKSVVFYLLVLLPGVRRILPNFLTQKLRLYEVSPSEI